MMGILIFVKLYIFYIVFSFSDVLFDNYYVQIYIHKSIVYIKVLCILKLIIVIFHPTSSVKWYSSGTLVFTQSTAFYRSTNVILWPLFSLSYQV
uniref:Uncharacterized protein n=1 Tax=Panstrongylus lignarius TaxID=156445 RepID=A0A224XV73_9HEMI